MEAYDAMMCAKCRDLENDKEHYDHACINFQGDYFKELIELTDYPNFDVDEVKQRFFEWENHKEEGIMTFRDNCYKSVMTGHVSPRLLDRDGNHLAWKDAMAETCESYGLWDLYDGNTRKDETQRKEGACGIHPCEHPSDTSPINPASLIAHMT